MPDSSTLVWIFVLVTLIPGGALLIGDRIPANTRSGLLLAGGGTWLAMASLIGTALIANRVFGILA